MPKYTFLLPAYKATFLDDALRSISAQAFTDYKVIISDDCSPEDIHAIAESYCHDARFAYRRNAVNIGGRSLVAHWNILVDMCDTDYLIMASDDDVFHPDFLSQIDNLTRRYPAVDVIRARVQTIDDNGKLIRKDPLLPEFVDEIGAYRQNACDINKCIANYVFRTESLKQKGGFIDYPLAWFSDIATILRQSANGQVNTTDILFSFRKSGLNISSARQTDNVAARRKLDAAWMYDEWMCSQLKRIVPDDKELGHIHKQEILRNAIMYSKVVSLWELLRSIAKFMAHGYFDDLSQFNWLAGDWIKAHIIKRK